MLNIMEESATIHTREDGPSGHDEHEDEHEPHMPPPSLSPIILAVGLTFLAFGILFGPVVIAIGVMATALGLGTWLYDEIRNAAAG
jgi:hypothetical protein